MGPTTSGHRSCAASIASNEAADARPGPRGPSHRCGRAPALNEDLVVTPNEFIRKWRASELKERSASQEHFIDLCRLLDEPTPAEADPTGDTYCFERGARRDAGGDDWADVWKRHHFAWEYKGRRANLDAAFNQLRQYALALENPPLLIVSDMVRFRIRTNWTNSVSRTHEFELDDLADAATRDRLKWAFSDPDRLRPGETRQSLTERVAASFASVAQALRERGHDPQAVAHFVNRLVFCMFADDVGLLLEDRPRYTPSTTFETFPFPVGLTPNVPAASYAADPATAIAEASRRLVELRDRWLNPPEWVEWVDEPVPGHPRRPVPRDEDAAKALRKRTLTNLYNARPQWLADAHAALDAAVAGAYGWPADISGDDAIRELLELNGG